MRVLRALSTTALVLLLTSCSDGVAPPAESRDAPITIAFDVGSAPVVTAVIIVSAPDIPNSLAFNLTITGTSATGTFGLPVGRNRTITVHLYAADGSETHRGSTVIDVKSGTNPPASIVLLPISSEVPIVVTVGSYTVTVTPAEPSVTVGATLQLNAVVSIGATPQAVTVQWVSLDPGLASVDADGLVRGLAAGTARIQARYASASSTVEVFVISDGSARPTVTIAPMIGVQRRITPIDYILADAEGDAASITVEYSADGGATWLPAARSGVLGEATTALAAAPAGTHHTFYWDGAVSTLAIAGPVSTVRIRITPSDALPGAPVATPAFTHNNNLDEAIAVATAPFTRDAVAERRSEVPIGNLIADALRLRAGTQLAIMNGGGIRNPLPSQFVTSNGALRRTTAPFDIVAGDVFNALPFSNRMVVRTVTGAQLYAALENSVSSLPLANGKFLQISGFSFTYRVANSPGARVISVTRNGGGVIIPDGTTYTLALPDFNNAGGDGYTMFADGTGTARETLANALVEYLLGAGTITPGTSARITEVL